MLAAQGNLPGALEAFRRSLALREQLAAADPGHAGCQRDLAVSHYKLAGLAQQQGDRPAVVARLQRCLAVLETMKARAMPLDLPLQQAYEQLVAMFGQ